MMRIVIKDGRGRKDSENNEMKADGRISAIHFGVCQLSCSDLDLIPPLKRRIIL